MRIGSSLAPRGGVHSIRFRGLRNVRTGLKFRGTRALATLHRRKQGVLAGRLTRARPEELVQLVLLQEIIHREVDALQARAAGGACASGVPLPLVGLLG